MVGEREGNDVALFHLELGDCMHVFAVKRDTGHQFDRVRPRHRVYSIVAAAHPGNGLPVAEAQREVHPHGHPPGYATHDTDDVHYLGVVRKWHEVHQGCRTFLRLESGFEDRRVGQVASPELR